MTDLRNSAWTVQQQPPHASPMLPPAALAGVRTRRIVAVCLDLIVVSVLCFVIWLVLGVLSLGLLWFVLPSLWPIVAFFYNGLSISGPRLATPGMRMADLEVRLTDGSRTPFINAALHAVMFYLSWFFPPVFLLSLFTSDKRCLHDILSGLIFTRRLR